VRISRDSDAEGGDRHSAQRRLILVAFTDRQGRLRLISAREVTRRERRDSEESQQGRA
jgi:uncharacterized DUF497 family protein